MAVDCALVTALPKELDKLLFHFGHSRPVESRNGRTYNEPSSRPGLYLSGNNLDTRRFKSQEN